MTGEIVFVCDADTLFDNDMVYNATRHFADTHVAAVSGNLRVLNWNQSMWTRLQAIEYIFAIGMTRTGLSGMNAVNNISGAFGVFGASLLRSIGGWSSGSAEDLDLTLRIKQYFQRHKGMKIVFENRAIGHTEAPATLWQYIKQRERWDGDLAYIYFRKHWHAFDPKLVGWMNYIHMLWMGLIHQVALPFLIILFTSWTLATDPLLFLRLTCFFYIIYTAFVFVAHLIHIGLFSERPKMDWKLLPWCFLYFPFSYITRIWSAFAILSELLIKAHLDSSMAPYWVLKQSTTALEKPKK